VSVTYDYPRPALTTDAAVFRIERERLQLLLVRRKNPPFQGMWSLPGGFLNEGETLDACAARELAEETGLTGAALHPFANFSTPGRDPRGWTVSAAYAGLADRDATAKAGDDAASLDWFDIHRLPPLAFDHAEIIARAIAWLGDQGPEKGIEVTHLL
jgi:8-oxo-dGTP diphosphatase